MPASDSGAASPASAEPMSRATGARPGWRWWPLGLILLAAGGALAVLWLGGMDPAQRNLATQALALVTAGLVALWFVLLSRATPRLRLRGAGVLLVIAAILLTTVRVEGLTGGLWLDLGWRWTPAGPSAQGPTAAQGRRVDLATTGPSDFPRFLGPLSAPRLPLVHWESAPGSQPPQTLWRRTLGRGWSSFAVVGDYAVTQEEREGQDCVVCYHRATGDEVWLYTDPETPSYASVVAGDGPRSTPTIFDGRVYAVGVTGRLRCLDGATGRAQWVVNPLVEHGGEPNKWGEAASPLVVDELVIVGAGHPSAGRTAADHPVLVAYDRRDGTTRWVSRGDATEYASPAVVELAGQRQVLHVSDRVLAGYDLATGDRLWSYDWSHPEGNIANPQVAQGRRVLVSAGYGFGCALVEPRRAENSWTVTEIWRNRNLKAKFANFVVADDHAYGFDDGILTCLELETGERAWKRGRYGHGQLLWVDGVLVIQAEDGRLVLVAADPNEHRELASYPALDGKTWNSPALAPPHLWLRNDREATCLRLPVALSPGDVSASPSAAAR